MLNLQNVSISSPELSLIDNPTMVKVFICGDIVNLFSNEQFIDVSLQEVIRSADLSIGNFEGVQSERVLPGGLKQTATTLNSLRESGFNLLLLANNHVADNGKQGLTDTIQSIEKNKMAHIGAGFSFEDAYRPYITSIGDVTIGIVNICECHRGCYKDCSSRFGYAWMSSNSINQIITDVRREVDWLFVMPHAGLEHCILPLKDFRYIYRNYCDLGADFVVASHPHIAQGIEQYKGSTIFYSLGNFYFPRKQNDDNNIENHSFSVLFNFDGKKQNYQLVYHKVEGLKVRKIDEIVSEVNVKELSRVLLSPEYETMLLNQNKQIFHSKLLRLYKEALNGIDNSDSFRKKVKNSMSYFMRDLPELNDLSYNLQLLSHLIDNESYRYLAIDVLKNYSYE